MVRVSVRVMGRVRVRVRVRVGLGCEAGAGLVRVDVELLEQELRALGDRSRLERRRVVGAHLVVLEEVLERTAHVEARLPDLRHLVRVRVRVWVWVWGLL